MSKFSDATFYLSPSGYKEGFIYPQKPLSSNGDVTFTRAGSAWRTNPDGQIEESPYNLLSYSEDFSNAVWTISAGSVTTDAIQSPTSTFTADKFIPNSTNTEHYVRQPITCPLGTYTYSVYIKAGEYTKAMIAISDFVSGDTAIGIDLTNGTTFSVVAIKPSGTWTNITYSVFATGNGWYKCTITGTRASGTQSVGTVYPMVSTGTNYIVGDGTSGIYLWGAQLVQGSLPKNYLATTNRQNFPRIDYFLGLGSLLLEPQRTNLLLNSVLSGGGSTPTSWTLAASTGTNTAVASIKNKNCTAYNFVVNSQRQILTQYVAVTSGVSYSFSIYVESVSTINSIAEFLVCAVLAGTINYYKNNVGISGSDVVTSNAVYTLVYVPSSTGSVELRIGAGCSSTQTANVTLSMPQFEQGAYSTTFIPTSTASVTRLVDTFSRSNLANNLISASGGTWLLDLRNSTTYIRDIFSQSISLGYFFNAVGADGFALTFGQSTPTGFQFRKYVGGVETTLYGSSTGTVKLLIKWNGSTADLFINGVKQISATVFTAVTMSHFFATGASTPINIQQTALWNTPLTDAQCIELTS